MNAAGENGKGVGAVVENCADENRSPGAVDGAGIADAAGEGGHRAGAAGSVGAASNIHGARFIGIDKLAGVGNAAGKIDGTDNDILVSRDRASIADAAGEDVDRTDGDAAVAQDGSTVDDAAVDGRWRRGALDGDAGETTDINPVLTIPRGTAWPKVYILLS